MRSNLDLAQAQFRLAQLQLTQQREASSSTSHAHALSFAERGLGSPHANAGDVYISGRSGGWVAFRFTSAAAQETQGITPKPAIGD